MEHDQLKDMILNSVVGFAGGWEEGGFMLGMTECLQYLTELADEGDTDAFVESASSLVMHMLWVDTPEPILSCVEELVGECLQANGIEDVYAAKLIQDTDDRLEMLAKLGPHPVGPGAYMLGDGQVWDIERLLGLQGAQFIIDVSEKTFEERGEAMGYDPEEDEGYDFRQDLH